MIKGHGGNIYEMARALGCSPREILDMSSNCSSRIFQYRRFCIGSWVSNPFQKES
jgi:hypothetical protein